MERRIDALEKIEARLREMKELAVYARDNDIGSAEAQELNERLLAIQEEAAALDRMSRVFRLDCQ